MAQTAQTEKKTGKFAVIKTGGKQYLVREGDVITIERLTRENDSDKVTFSEVLMTGEGDNFSYGTPFLSGSDVEGEFVADTRAKKVVVMKFKAKSNYFVKNGHKQLHTKVRITKL